MIQLTPSQKELVAKMTETENLDILMEECAELIQAASKYKRSMGLGLPTPVSKEDAISNFIEEVADVIACILQQFALSKDIEVSTEVIENIMEIKAKISVRRMNQKLLTNKED